MINITAVGRLAHQPELRTGRQTSFCEFRLLSTRFARGEQHTEAVTFICYAEEAERFCEMTEKGQLIEATGTQETQRWTDSSGAEHRTVKYKLTWWSAGARPRSRGEAEERNPQRTPAPYGAPRRDSEAAAGRSAVSSDEAGDKTPLI